MVIISGTVCGNTNYNISIMVIIVRTFLGFLLQGLHGWTWATHDHGLLPDVGRDHVLSY